MDIAQAKQQIKDTVRVYLERDEKGEYCVPLVHQRPVYLQGAPGLGKTAVMQQISYEMGIGLVSYSMTHHTRQSAIGLPMIVDKVFAGEHYSVSEYTMSEIIASVYECMESTGKKEGILFLDEINCISETLMPSMLLFLQYKTFGGHTLPEGWVVVTAGNPKQYNKSAREFDPAIKDRLQFLKVEPQYDSWRTYALEKGISGVIKSYLDIKTEHFYAVENTVEGLTVVTPRSWEDLSKNLQSRERLGISIDENLIGQFLQNVDIARDFAVYYELYKKYENDFDADAILAGSIEEDRILKAKAMPLRDRITCMELLTEALFHHMEQCLTEYDALKAAKQELSSEQEKAEYQKNLMQLKTNVSVVQSEIENVINYTKAAYGKGNEISMLMNDMTLAPVAVRFLGMFLNGAYVKSSKEVSLHHQEEELLKQIDVSL